MEIYWIIGILTVLINLIPVKNLKQYSFRLVISLIPLFIYGAFRVNYGLDYSGYEDYFDSVKKIGLDADDRIEIGYYYINKILPTFRSLLVVQSILLCLSYYYIFRWHIPAKWAWLGFSLLFLSGHFTIIFMLSGIRNGIAISIFMLSTYYIIKRRIILFAIFLLIAYTIHNSVVLFAPILYFFGNRKPITKKYIVNYMFIISLLFIASTTILLNYVEVFITSYFFRYIAYVEIAKDLDKGTSILVSLFSIVGSIILLLIFKDKKLTPNEIFMVKISLLFFMAFLLGSLNMRVTQFLGTFWIVGSVIAIKTNTSKLLKQSYIFLTIIYLIYALKIWYENPYFNYSNYESILF